MRFLLLLLSAPRLAFVFIWAFTSLVERAFSNFLWPLLGVVFLPFTSIMYVLVYSPVNGLTGWDWVWILLALFIDLGSYGGSAVADQYRSDPQSVESSTSSK